MVSFIFKIIWQLSEFTGIPIGRFAPYVFGKMINSEPHELTKEDIE